MRITIVSDTHNLHDRVDLPAGDVLIHCGDMFDLFQETSGDIERMDEWFGTLDFDLILCTGGNHDVALEERARTSETTLGLEQDLHGIDARIAVQREGDVEVNHFVG